MRLPGIALGLRLPGIALGLRLPGIAMLIFLCLVLWPEYLCTAGCRSHPAPVELAKLCRDAHALSRDVIRYLQACVQRVGNLVQVIPGYFVDKLPADRA